MLSRPKGINRGKTGREILAKRREVYHTDGAAWLLARSSRSEHSMNDESDPSATESSHAPAPVAASERSGRNRRRNRRGKGNRSQQSPPVENAIPSAGATAEPEIEPQRAAQQPRHEPRPSEPKRSRGHGFADGVDHQICAYCAPVAPATYPVQGRTGLAVMPLQTIAELNGARLQCDLLHDGECAWPDLTPVDPAFAVSRNWTLVIESGTPWLSAPQESDIVEGEIASGD